MRSLADGTTATATIQQIVLVSTGGAEQVFDAAQLGLLATVVITDQLPPPMPQFVLSPPERIAPSPGMAPMQLWLNAPNPPNPATTIRYSLSGGGPVSLRIYDVSGQLFRELVTEERLAGAYRVEWDGRNGAGHQVASGVYLYELRVGGYESVKMLLMK